MYRINSSITVAMCLVITPPAVAQDIQPTTTTNQLASTEVVAVILADIADAERISGANLSVEGTGGTITLSGTVHSLQDKRLASSIAKRTRGVRAVLNQIVVRQSDRSDAGIREDVLNVLAANDSVDQPQIVVNVSGGVVAMTGKVDSLAEKTIAEFAVSGVRGVTSVENQLTVALSSDRPDRDLRDEINALIVQSVYFDDVDIDVQVEKQVAKLSGTVHSVHQRDQLERTAGIWGVSAVDLSGVEIDPEGIRDTDRAKRYGDITDSSITVALKRSFHADTIVFSRAEDIEISVDSRIVTLQGTVDRLRVKNRAEQLANDVVGVNRVHNNLKVEYSGGEQLSDTEIAAQTKAALARSAHLELRDLRVHCQNAHVSLYGVVESDLEKRIAEWIADGVAGVVHVNNSLAVEKKWRQKSDEKIQADIERKLKFAFFDRSNQIDVEVHHGTAIIRGTVDTWRQWQAVMDLALEAGARNPHNLINVRFHPPRGASRMYVPE